MSQAESVSQLLFQHTCWLLAECGVVRVKTTVLQAAYSLADSYKTVTLLCSIFVDFVVRVFSPNEFVEFI